MLTKKEIIASSNILHWDKTKRANSLSAKPTMDWKKIISDKSVEIVLNFEKSDGRTAKDVHKDGVGYDILSKDANNERYIEVKSSSELWATLTWLPIYKSEFRTLRKFPKNFYLYIIKFHLSKEDRNKKKLDLASYDIFIINGQDLLKRFNIRPETYSVSPISRRRLENYRMKKCNATRGI